VKKGEAHDDLAIDVGRNRVQLQLEMSLTPEQYGAQRAWEKASLERCPLHPTSSCGLSRHGTYLRKHPIPLKIARYYCKKGQTTFSLLPDFFSAKLPGTLDELEHAVVVAEESSSLKVAADKVRPPETWETGDDEVEQIRDPITLEATMRWVRRRVILVHAALLALVAVMPEVMVGTGASLLLVRKRLDTESALLTLRRRSASHLSALPPPLGFGPRPSPRKHGRYRTQQSMGPTRGP